jgi:flagellar biogenesis protein FliO
MALKMVKFCESNTTASKIDGLAGWVLALFRSRCGQREVERKLRVVETLALGGKRQLMLVTCGGESFLVGGGLDSVETIVRVNADRLVDAPAKDESCR